MSNMVYNSKKFSNPLKNKYMEKLIELFSSVGLFLLGGIGIIASLYYLQRSKKFETDIGFASAVIASLYLLFTQNLLLACLIWGCLFIFSYGFILWIKNLADRDQFFTVLSLNEYKVVEKGKSLAKFIGFAERWVNKEGKPVAQGSDEAIELVTFVPHPTTGRIRPLKDLKKKNELGKIDQLNHYIFSRLGIVWIGLPGIISIKTFDLRFKTTSNGKLVTKNYTADNGTAVTSIFDSFIYVFEARDLETKSTIKMFITCQIRMYVDNLHVPSYEALPAGRWTDLAEGEFRDIAKEHVSRTDFTDVLIERDSQTVKDHGKAHAINETLYNLLRSDEAKQKFIKICGHYPDEVDIYDQGLELDPEAEEAYKQQRLNEVRGNAEIMKQQKQTEIEIEKVKQSEQQKLQQENLGMAKVLVDKAYVMQVIEPIKNNAAALDLLGKKEISTMKELRALSLDGKQNGTYLVRDDEKPEKSPTVPTPPSTKTEEVTEKTEEVHHGHA